MMKFSKRRVVVALAAFTLLVPGVAAAVSPFVDVAPGKFYEAPINWAFSNGITNGRDATHFAPEAGVTRGESVTFLKRYHDKVVQPLVDGIGSSLGQLSCTTDQVAHFNGTAWVCGTAAFDYSMATASLTTLETLSDSGVDMAIGADGLPVISNFSSGTRGAGLAVFHCRDKDCATGSSTLLDTVTRSNVGTAIAIGSDGLPVVAYAPHPVPSSPGIELRLMHCSDLACTSGTQSVLDSTGDAGASPSITIGTDGLPVIAYVEINNNALKLFHCSNLTCTTGSITPLDPASAVGVVNAVALTVGSDGFPFIVYSDSTGAALSIHCTIVTCGTYNKSTVLPSGGFDRFDVVIGADGLPIISYNEPGTKRIRVHHCANAACNSGTSTTIETMGTAGLWGFSSIDIGIDQLPVVAYNTDPFNLKVFRCADTACTSGTTLLIDNPSQLHLGLVVAPDGSPTIAYIDTSALLRVARLDMAPTGIRFS